MAIHIIIIIINNKQKMATELHYSLSNNQKKYLYIYLCTLILYRVQRFFKYKKYKFYKSTKDWLGWFCPYPIISTGRSRRWLMKYLYKIFACAALNLVEMSVHKLV